jgi:hypothetical protein
VTQFNGYLTEEVVEDYSDGILSRREALRRLGMLGVAVTVAVPLLAACDAANQEGAAPTTAGPAGAAPAGPSPLPTESITFDVRRAVSCRVPGRPPPNPAAGSWSSTRTAASPTTSGR